MYVGAIQWRDNDISAKQLARIQHEAILACQRANLKRRSTEPLVFSHLTALNLLGVEVPIFSGRGDYRAPQSRRGLDTHQLHVSFREKARRSSPPGITTHVWNHDFRIASVVGGIACMEPADVWKQLAAFLSLQELVVLGDSMMRGNPRLKRAQLRDFSACLQKSDAFVGKDKCNRALPLMRENTDSSQESRVRLLLEKNGIRGGIVNFAILDQEKGVTHRVDIAYPELHLIIEYDGKHHSESKQWNYDVGKRARLHELGWTVVEVNADNMRSKQAQNELVASILTRLGDPRISR
jgi:very-short-patch-repair endonuclease